MLHQWNLFIRSNASMLNTRCKAPMHTSARRLTARGSVMIEAVMVMLLFLAFVGAVMYWALTLHYRHTLSDGMMTTLRRISTNVNQTAYPNPDYSGSTLTAASGTSLANMGPSAIGRQVIDHMQQKKMIPHIDRLSVESMSICRDNLIGDCRMKIKMTYVNPCYLCIFMGLTTVEVQAESGIEDPCFRTDSETGGRGCFDPSIPMC